MATTGGGAAQEAAAAERPSAARFAMYGFFFMTCTLHFLVREMAPSLVPFIADEFGWTLQQKGVLLGSYFPGYIIGQVPAALVADSIGGKLTLTLANVGTVLAMLATPAARSVRAASLAMNFLGLCGGTMFPVSGMLKKLWIPETLAPTERAFALRVTTWGVNIGRFFTAFFTPLLALRFGWRAVPLLYGAAVAVFAVPFQLLATNSPTEWAARARPAMSRLERKLLGVDLTKGDTYVVFDKERHKYLKASPRNRQRAQQQQEQTVAVAAASDQPTVVSKPVGGGRYKFLLSLAAWCPIALHTADNMTSYCLAYWAPTYFAERFALSPAQIGVYLGATHLISMAGCVLAPLGEVAVLKMGASHRAMRRLMGGLGSCAQAACITLFPVLPTPMLAAACYAANNLFKCFTNDGGYYTNYMEVGGARDVGVLYGFGQTVSNFPGPLITAGGAWLKMLTGSWAPLFLGCGAFQLLAGLLFGLCAQVKAHDDESNEEETEKAAEKAAAERTKKAQADE